MRPIRWLHLSDLHLGCAGRGAWWQTHEEFAQDVRKLVLRRGPPDLLLLTGDLTFSGQAEQFDRLDEFLDALKGWIGAEPILLPVPGNHDLTWPRGAAALSYAALDRYGQAADPSVQLLREILWQERDASLIDALFANYRAWFERRVLAQWQRRGVEHHASFFPGDFRARIELPGCAPLGVVGLNSAWCHYRRSKDENEFRGRLHLTLEQFHAALAPDGAGSPLAALAPGEPALLLQHHPLEWLAPAASATFRDAIYTGHRFSAALYGHMHDARSEYVAVAGGAPRCYYQSSSLFGDPRSDPDGHDRRRIGGTWGEIGADHAIRVWPRKRVRHGDGSGGFVHDDHFPEPDGDAGVCLREGRRSGAVARPATAENDVDFTRCLSDLRDRTATLKMEGFGSRPGAQRTAVLYRIDELYTRLRARDERATGVGDGHERVELGQVLPRHPHLLIVGEAGSGKTTFLKLVANLLARDRLHEDPPPGASSWRAARLGMQDAEPLLPVLLPLERMAALLAARDPRPDDRERLLDLLDPGKDGGADCGVTRDDWRHAIEAGKVYLLLDGLDEVTDSTHRNRLFAILDDAVRNWRPCRVVVTSRPFQTDDVRALGFAAVAVEPFDDAEIQTFLERWVRGFHGIAEGDPLTGEAIEHDRLLKAAIRERPRLGLLASNPVMLTCLCVIHFNEGKLPESKTRVYRAVMRWLIAAREEQRRQAGFNDSLAQRGFACLALAMLAGPAGKRATIDFDDAAQALDPVFQRDYPKLDERGRRDRARGWLTFECMGSGIVQEIAGRRVRFWHLTFEEYFAALESSWADDGGWSRVKDHLDDAQWRETVDLLPGCLHDGGVGKVDAFLGRILAERRQPAELAVDARIAGVVGRLLASLEGEGYQPPPEVRAQYRDCLDRALAIFTVEGAARVAVKDRVAAAEALGRGGDPRLGNPEANLLPVPGTGIRLGKYPVTVEEFQEFVEHGGYDDRQWWDPDGDGWRFRTEGQWTAPGDWIRQLQTPNRPVVEVSWYEAAAYCRWLARLRRTTIRLPTDEEWEQAATPERGKYPWGDVEPDPERANYEGKIGAPTPVGIYPKGMGPYGHLDLAGNVWEWCGGGPRGGGDVDNVNKWGPVFSWRGGSWPSGAGDLAAAVRVGYHATRRRDRVGFRVVSVPASTVGS